MSKISKMQGVPAYLETLKSDGVRRHISWCVHSIHLGHHQYECTCKESPYNDGLCHSAKRCAYYQKRG